MWYYYFVDPYTPMYTYGHLLGFFFLCVWSVPFGFFITVTVDNMALPGAGIYVVMCVLNNEMIGAEDNRIL